MLSCVATNGFGKITDNGTFSEENEQCQGYARFFQILYLLISQREPCDDSLIQPLNLQCMVVSAVRNDTSKNGEQHTELMPTMGLEILLSLQARAI